MAVIKCKMCGGDLVLTEGSTVAECEYCGTRQTVPVADNEKKLIQFERAERLRRNCEFDKAAGLYEAIVSEFRQEAEAYWGLVLCKYGIEYVDDPATGRKIPTCHRSSFDSVLEDSNFDQAMENADEEALRVYRQEAKQIETIRRGILEVSSSEKPYDIFICYKETDSKGNRTVDSLLAQDIYDALVVKGYRVFFSRITLEDKLGQAYEPYIFAALNSAKIMLAVGTCYEHYNAVWVKNEWSRYLKIIAQDKGKYLIPCYKNIDPYDIPREFAHLQGQDMGKVGAIADLLRGVEKLISSGKSRNFAVLEKESGVNNKMTALLERGYLALEDGEWAEADRFFEEVLNNDAKNAGGYLGKLLAEFRVVKVEELCNSSADFTASNNYRKAQRFGDDNIRNLLEQIRKDRIYHAARKRLDGDAAKLTKSDYREAAAQLSSISGWRDAEVLLERCQSGIRKIEEREESLKQEKACKKAERDRKRAKKTRSLLLTAVIAVAVLVMLLNPVTIGLYRSASSDGDKKDVSFTTVGNITVHSFRDKQMENGKIRYVLDVTIPETEEITVYDLPSRQLFHFNLLISTVDGRQTIVFEMDENNVAAVDMFVISFKNQNSSDDMWIYAKPNHYSVQQIATQPPQTEPPILSEPPTPNCKKVSFTTVGNIAVHGFWDEQAAEGQICYTVDLTAPSGGTVTVMDTVYQSGNKRKTENKKPNQFGYYVYAEPVNGELINLQLEEPTVEGRQTIAFCLDSATVAKADRLIVRFRYSDNAAEDLTIFVKPNQYHS